MPDLRNAQVARAHSGPSSTLTMSNTIRNGMWWDAMSGTLDYGAESMSDISKSQFTRMMMADISRKLRTFYPMVLMRERAEIYLDYVQQYNPDTELHPDPFFSNAMALYELGGDI